MKTSETYAKKIEIGAKKNNVRGAPQTGPGCFYIEFPYPTGYRVSLFSVSESLNVNEQRRMTEDPQTMSETFANEFYYEYFTGNLTFPAPQPAFCGNLGSESIVITYEYDCKLAWQLMVFILNF